VRDQARHLAACLDGVARASLGTTVCEVVVVDDGSHDDSGAVAGRHGARVVRIEGRGPAAARNAGARVARGEALIFLDADCVPEPECFVSLLASLADPCVSGVRGAYASDQRALVARFVQLELEEKQARLAASSEIAVVDTVCAAYRRSVFAASGGFDERFVAPSVEDVELSFRLAAQGHRLVFAPGARVRHQHATDLATYLRRKLRFGFHRAQLYRAYPERLREDGYTPRLMPTQIVLSAVVAALALAGVRSSSARGLAAVATGAFLATALPLASRAWATDRGLALAVPGFLLARSWAQALGLLAGTVVAAAGTRMTAHEPAHVEPQRTAAVAPPARNGQRSSTGEPSRPGVEL
jgi:GT2 family glycosyltransferase